MQKKQYLCRGLQLTISIHTIMRKIYAFLAVCLLSISAWAADDYKIGYTVFDAKTGTLTYYYDYNSKRKDVGGSVYDPTIERFKGYASDIKKAVIDASFKDCTTLKSTRRMFFSGNAANPLVNLTEITGMENLKTENVTSMEEMFYGCRALETLDLSNFDTRNVTDMKYMFDDCESLKAVNLSSFNTENVNDYNGMFNKCVNLTIVNLSNFNVKSGSKVSSMFNGCEKLKTIYCNDDWTKKDIDADDLFEGCTSLVGGNGTVYDDYYTYLDYARPDTKDAKGYFTTYSYDTRAVVTTCELDGFNVNLLPCMATWTASREQLIRYYIEPEDDNAPYKVVGSRLMLFNEKNEEYIPMEFGDKLFPGQYIYQVILSIEGDEAADYRFPNAKESKVIAKMGTNTWYAEKAVVFDGFSTVAINSPAIFLEKEDISTPESYASFDESISTLTYYYDMNRYEHAEVEEVVMLPWTDGAFYLEYANYIGRIVIDESFRNSNLTSSLGLFHAIEDGHGFGLTHVGEINGLENLNTKTMTDLSLLFAFMECLVEIDLTVLDLSEVTTTVGMFGMCTNLKKILCDEDLTDVDDSDDMFVGCVNLVGGNGTACDGENDIDADYARPDWKDQPGYFTATKPQSVESIQNSEVSVQKVLRDGKLFIERDGKTYNAQGAEVR